MKLSHLNHWWKSGSLSDDPHIKAALASKLSYSPTPIQPQDLTQPKIISLRGPRQVGKTTALKQLVKALIEEHDYPPKSILWTTGDTLRRTDLLETHLVELIETYKAFKLKPQDTPPLLIIDEVTSVEQWQRALKALWDDGRLRPFVVLVTGSSTSDLRTGSEKMAGRRGIGKNLDKTLFHMSFADFLKEIPTASVDDYLSVGGYPVRVAQFKQSPHNFDPFYAMNVIEEALLSEVARRNLDRNISFEVLARLFNIGSTAVSFDAFAKGTSTTKDTVRKHLSLLGDAYFLATYASFDHAKKRASPKKDRKFLGFDPAFRYLARHLEIGPVLDTPLVAEMAVGAHLIRCYENRSFEGLAQLHSIHTWKGAKQKEVDFVYYNPMSRKTFPVEVKYQASISEWDWQTMEKSFGTGTLVTRNQTETAKRIQLQGLATFLRSNNPVGT